MRSEWEVKLIEDIDFYIGDGNYSSKYPKSSEFISEGIPFFSASDIQNGRLRLSDVRYISIELHSSLKKGHIKKDDVLIVTRGNGCGGVALVDSEFEDANINAQLVLIRQGNEVSGKYLYYYMCHMNFTGQINGFITGSAQPQIPIKSIKKISIVIPPVQTQKKIAHILSTLDDKIELNRKMNQTLEAMAQALFKSWFVDFDPVHVKLTCKSEEALTIAAKKLGISKEILDLFPSEFETSELGMIPKGWENDYLDTFVEILDSKRVPLASNEREKIKGDIPYYGATSIMGYVNDYIFDEILLLMGEDGSVVRDDGTPFLQYIWGKSWVNNHAHVMKSKSTLSVEALYIALINKNVTMFVTGAVQPKINQGNLKQIPIINAGEIVNKTFSSLIEPIFAKIRLISEENTSLQKTRDTLLPKLLSGELDVSNLPIGEES